MAVVMSSKFYQANVWKDISKIVFSSPNMNSPSIAGTRSHILPGEGEIGTWYEDTSQMFRIEDHQYTTESDFFNYRMKSSDEVNLLLNPGYIDVKQINYPGFDTFVKDNSGVEIIGYEDITSFVTHSSVRLEYTPIHKNLDEIFQLSSDLIDETVLRTYRQCSPDEQYLYYNEYLRRSYGWYTPVIADFVNCYLTFEFDVAVRVAAVSMSSISIENIKEQYPIISDCDDVGETPPVTTTTSKRYFIGNFTIQGSNNKSTWITIATSSNTTNLTKFVYSSNTSYYKYYRVSITNNTGLNTTTFDSLYYGISKLRFYTYEFSTSPGTDYIAVYECSDPDDPKIFKVSNAYALQSSTPEYDVTSTFRDVVGSVVISYNPGGSTASTYNVDIKSTTDPYDYLTLSVCESTSISGIGVDDEATVYVKEDKKNLVLDATTEFINVGLPNEMIYFYATGSHSVVVDNSEWEGDALITYNITASGTRVGTTDTYGVEGIAERVYDSVLFSKRSSFRLVISDVVTGGVILEDADLYVWGNNERPLDLDTMNSIVFEVTIGEAYNCRLTAWDDVTHSTTINELIQGDHVRCSAMAYCSKGTKIDPLEVKQPLNLVYPPAHNVIFKGNTFDSGVKYYYGDFDLVYRHQTGVIGDFLIFKPMLYGIDNSISYGVHDYVITLHYSYT